MKFKLFHKSAPELTECDNCSESIEMWDDPCPFCGASRCPSCGKMLADPKSGICKECSAYKVEAQ